jgi:hypothetical protein
MKSMRWHIRLTLVLLALPLILLKPSSICHGQSQYDQDALTDVQKETGESPSEFDIDAMDEMEVARESNPPEEPGPKSLFTTFLDQSVWTLGYRASHTTGTDPKLINNHLYLRQQLGLLISDTYFLKLDWKARGYPKTDHMAEARDKDIYLEADLREGYVQAGYDNFGIKIGSQINVWGKADTMAVTDVVSPKDASEFIFFKIEDARFGQWMVSSTVYQDNSSLFVFLNPLPGTDKMPDANTHYFRPIPGKANYTLVEDAPELGDMEAGVKIDHFFSKTEASLMAGRFYANSPVYETKEQTIVHETYPAYTMIGMAVSQAFESFLIKFEMAFKKEFPLQGMDVNGGYLSIESDVMDGAAGIEYNANGAYFMSLELSNRHIFTDRSSLVQNRQDSASLYYTLTKDFFYETLSLEYNFYFHLQEQNHFHNFQATYDLTDAIEIQVRYTLLRITDTQSLMWAYKDEDRAAIELRYSF